MTEETPRPWYRRWPVMILLFLCLTPVWVVLIWTDRRSSAPLKVFAALMLCLSGFAIYNAWRNPDFQEMREGNARWEAASPAERRAMFFEPRTPGGWSPSWEITDATRAELVALLGPPDEEEEGNPVYLGPAIPGVLRRASVTFELDEKGRVDVISTTSFGPAP